MKIRESNKLNMYVTVSDLLEARLEIFISLAAMGTAKDEFQETVQRIIQLGEAQASRTGAAAAKKDARISLGDLAYEVAAAVMACAEAKNDPELAGRVDFSPSEVAKGRAGAVVSRCQGILTTASEVQEFLPTYGMNAGKLSALNKKVTGFQKAQTKPRNSIASSSAATKQLPGLFRRVDSMLKRRLDKMAVQFKTSQPDFFNEYKTSRAIVDLPGGRTAKKAKAEAASKDGAKPKAA